MGRIMAVEFLTLDGVFEEPAWTQAYFDEAVGAYQGEAMQWADALLLGRVTYDGMSQAWPAMGNDPSTGGDIMNSIGKYVPTSTLTDPTWNATFLHGDVVDEVTKLKGAPRTSSIYGSGQLTETLRAAGLIDEYRLLICRSCWAGPQAVHRRHADRRSRSHAADRAGGRGAARPGQGLSDVGRGRVRDDHDALSVTFGALADPTRRAILARLAEGDATVNALAALFPSISLQAVSKHLKVLERAGLSPAAVALSSGRRTSGVLPSPTPPPGSITTRHFYEGRSTGWASTSPGSRPLPARRIRSGRSLNYGRTAVRTHLRRSAAAGLGRLDRPRSDVEMVGPARRLHPARVDRARPPTRRGRDGLRHGRRCHRRPLPQQRLGSSRSSRRPGSCGPTTASRTARARAP